MCSSVLWQFFFKKKILLAGRRSLHHEKMFHPDTFGNMTNATFDIWLSSIFFENIHFEIVTHHRTEKQKYPRVFFAREATVTTVVFVFLQNFAKCNVD